MHRRSFPTALGATLAAASAGPSAAAQTAAGVLRAPRLEPGDTIALINPSRAIHEREPYAIAIESLQALGLKVREAPNLRARYGHLAGADRQRADDVDAMFADRGVHGILAMAGGSGGNRMLPLVDYELIRRQPNFLGGNLAVLTAMAGSPYWPSFKGAILLLEDINEFIYRIDRMLSTLKLAGVLDQLAGVVLGASTNCTPGDGYGTLALDEVFDDYFKGLGIPVYRGAQFGHNQCKFTLPIGLPVEMDAAAGTLQYLSAAVQ